MHDLRATFVTVNLANGRSETWVADRTGHRSSEMVNRYRRGARTWAETNLGALGPLDALIPELGPLPRPLPQGDLGQRSRRARNSLNSSGEGGIRTRGTVARTHDFQSEEASGLSRVIEKSAADGDGGSPEIDRLGATPGQSGDVERALSFALTEAAKAGRFDLVAQLAKELEARRRSVESS